MDALITLTDAIMNEVMPNIPPSTEQPPVTLETIKNNVAELSKGHKITRDQERIADEALENPDFALMANRALKRGTDPELLRRTVPEAVYFVATQLGLSQEEADKAIETAHKIGPGSLPIDSKQEWLWLILAKYSVDEAEQQETPAATLRASAKKIVAMENYSDGKPSPEAVEADAREYRKLRLAETQPIGKAPQQMKNKEGVMADIPVYDKDLGFYAAYRSGSPIGAVKDKDGLLFYGSDGTLTLEEAGVKVDKPLSPYFGIVFPPKAE